MIWDNLSIYEVKKNLSVNEKTGLTDQQVKERLSAYGYNRLEEKQHKSLFRRFLSQLNDYMIIILLIAAAVSYGVSVIQGDRDFVDSIIILAIVILNAVIGVFQESKAEKALEALKNISASKAKVLRNGLKVTVNTDELTIGDIVFLKSGDFVPADCRILKAVDLKTDESSLTGESKPIQKDPGAVHNESTPIADVKNMIWSSTAVVSGSCTAIVVAVGMDTEVGKIADMIIKSETPQTPLQQRLAKTGKILGTVALALCGVIFLLGVLKKIPVFEMFMTSVSLAVAAIPEGLPAIVTVMLAMGVQRMAGKNAIVRKLPAIETLGSANVICSDKTGTLTQNKMTVTDIYGGVKKTLSLAVLCCNNTDATENAIIEAAEKVEIKKEELDKQYPRVSEVPFNSTDKFMITVHRLQNGYRIIMKGAPDVVLNKCNIPYTEKSAATHQLKVMGNKALRVLAVAYRDVDSIPAKLDEELHFMGLLGMIDPPRPEVKDAVALCKKAGIKPVMITGDHVDTAVAVAKEIGIISGNEKAVTGKELDRISDEKLYETINDYGVFARVTPQHKVRIVNTFQKRDGVVAMTGDGVNDAPALKNADIGCAMGITGTDVARGAADMVLTDDNFATIVEAVRQGRGIYANIVKSIHFLLSCNIGEILTILVALVLGWQSPLISIQLLWVNLITDSLPAISLGFEKIDKDIMTHKPIDKKKGMFADGLGTTIVLEGIMVGLLSILAFAFGNLWFHDLTIARTMAFCVLSMSQLIHALNIRSNQSIFRIGLLSNKFMLVSFILCLFLQVSVVTCPFLASLFRVVPLDAVQWRIVAMLSIAPLLVMELVKMLGSVSFKRQVKVVEEV